LRGQESRYPTPPQRGRTTSRLGSSQGGGPDRGESASTRRSRRQAAMLKWSTPAVRCARSPASWTSSTRRCGTGSPLCGGSEPPPMGRWANPDGADTRVRAASFPRSSRYRNRRRATGPRLRRGTCSFVMSRGPVMTTSLEGSGPKGSPVSPRPATPSAQLRHRGIRARRCRCCPARRANCACLGFAERLQRVRRHCGATVTTLD
jgi:hypothetical protein